MSYEAMRRSARIPKELAVLLTGSDLDGKGFSEMTKTVLLSRHGAGIVSTYKLHAEQEIILRYLDTNKEAVVRVCGRIGDEGELYTYGVAFVDQTLIDFWDVDFAPVSEKEKEARRVDLACATCGQRETVEHIDVESDVLMINDGIVRYCKECHDSTLWKRSAPAPEEEPELVATPTVSASRFAGASSTATIGAAHDRPDAASPSGSAPSSAFSGAGSGGAPGSAAVSDAKPASAYAGSSAPVAPPPPPALKPDNRRKHSRMKVTYKACIRRSGLNDDVVTCEDMSKGGISFKSRKRYFQNSEIEVAVPFAPGGNAIFVPARIAWVQEITPDKLYRCGVEYRITSRPS